MFAPSVTRFGAQRRATVTAAALLTVGALAVSSGGCATQTEGATGGTGGAGTVGGAAADDDASGVGTTGGAPTAAGPGGGGGPSTNCGDGQIEAPETCDGADLGGRTCADFGLSPGDLQCNGSCQIVVSGCGVPENCTNGLDDDADNDIDCADEQCSGVATCLDSCAAPLAVGVPTLDIKSTLGRPNIYAPSCAAVSGPEIVYAVTPSANGFLGISVSQWTGNFSVSVMTSCGDVASEIGCASDTKNRSFAENLQVAVQAGVTYFVMVDAADPAQSGDFDVFMFMVDGGEAACFDLDDGDADGLIDCNDPDCQTNTTCTDGTSPLGSSCSHTGQCASAQTDPICLSNFYGFTGGYCSEFCDLGANDCPGDGQCFDYGIGTAGVCLDGCNTNTDCRTGYACLDLGLASKACYIAPESDCDDFQDDDHDGLTDCVDPDCQATPTCMPGNRGYGEGCTANNQCASAAGTDPLCLRNPPFFFTNGYCSEFCNVGASDCGEGGVCHDWFYLDGSTGQCFKRCLTSANCASGQTCVDHGFGKHCNL